MDSINNTSKFGGDAWLELQAFKTRQINRRERLNRNKDLINRITTNSQPNPSTNSSLVKQNNPSINNADDKFDFDSCRGRNSESHTLTSDRLSIDQLNFSGTQRTITGNKSTRFQPLDRQTNSNENTKTIDIDGFPTQHHSSSFHQSDAVYVETVECLLLLRLCDVALKLPIDSNCLQRSICRVKGLEGTQKSTIENLLEKFAHQELITIEEPSNVLLNHRGRHNASINGEHDEEPHIHVISADHTKLVEFDKTFGSSGHIRSLLLETRNEDSDVTEVDSSSIAKQSVPIQTVKSSSIDASHLSHTCEEAVITGHARGILQQELSNQVDISNRSSVNNRARSKLDPKKRSASDDVESLLSLSSTKERESKKLGEELLELLSKPTAKERNLLERFRSADGHQVQEFCPKGTKDECRRNNRGTQACDKLHFKKIIAKHTEESLGDCSFLNTCFHMDSCKYVHYEVDCDDKQQLLKRRAKSLNQEKLQKSLMKKSLNDANSDCVELDKLTHQIGPGLSDFKSFSKEQLNLCDTFQPIQSMAHIATNYTLSPEEQIRIEIRNRKRFKTVLYPPQWIQCDLRYFDMSLLGKFSVVMADPPWDIHMELPYGTMSDDEMRKLNVPALQDEGVIFLWVTGRAMELGRECLALWGYERCDEIIWVKTNQLQRIIRTGRTGHWLNHGKEHCLVGVKGNPTEINRRLDCDIIVAEVRATSHKPDEIYGIIERLSPGTRKIELFGRAHNVQPNWVTLGNQLNGVRLVEPNLIEAFKILNLPYQTSDQL